MTSFITGAYCPQCAESDNIYSVFTRSSVLEDIDFACRKCGHNWRLVIVVVRIND